MVGRILNPRATGEFVAKLAKDVTIIPAQVNELAEKIFQEFSNKKFSPDTWREHELHPKEANIDAIHWIFVADTLNFSFWSSNPYGVKFDDKLHTGYWSIHAAIRRALEEGIKVTSADYLANITKEDVEHILRSDTSEPIPLLEERYRGLKEAGGVLMDKFDGSFANCILQSENSAQKLVELVVQNFNSYKDEAEYSNQQVSFYKRAQILVADIWACFRGEGLGKFNDIDYLTMFADYRVPQVLVYFGAMQYSSRLMEKLKKGEILQNGDQLEVEIRGCSIATVEYSY